MKTSLLLILGMLSACADRTHLWNSYGQANRRTFRSQVIDPHAGEKQKADPGLDPEEAAIVVETYRKNLAGNNGNNNAQPKVLVVDPKANPNNTLPVTDK